MARAPRRPARLMRTISSNRSIGEPSNRGYDRRMVKSIRRSAARPKVQKPHPLQKSQRRGHPKNLNCDRESEPRRCRVVVYHVEHRRKIQRRRPEASGTKARIEYAQDLNALHDLLGAVVIRSRTASRPSEMLAGNPRSVRCLRIVRLCRPPWRERWPSIGKSALAHRPLYLALPKKFVRRNLELFFPGRYFGTTRMQFRQ